MKTNNLVIVESPAKTKTLSKILGSGYTIKATMGHIRDLPKSQLGIDVENNFEPKYISLRDKSKVIKELKNAVKSADMVYLASDPDREGEAIAWHTAELLKLKDNYKRVVFQEITADAIKRAFKKPRDINHQLINAQQARRLLDRLVGYKLSPLLWRKVQRGLSAGRVQSIAVKIVVDREREIENFKPEEYWTIEGLFFAVKDKNKQEFKAQLVASSEQTKLKIKDKEQSDAIAGQLSESAFKVLKVKTKKVTKRPLPPFITSTLQQEAWRRHRFSAKQTMALAQQLYEGLPVGAEGTTGLITYMRTDSVKLSREATKEAREFILNEYGEAFVPAHAHVFTRQSKGAQEAHEAIRPTKVARTPLRLKKFLNIDQFKIYKLIWERMIASQMASATYNNTSVDIEAKHPTIKNKYIFRTSDMINTFAGYTKLYQDESAEEKEASGKLPALSENDGLTAKSITPEQKFTQPPSRYTEASLIKALEQFGIGRPSTYAPTLSTIVDREYVKKENGSFKANELGMVVNDLLVQHFSNVINIEFTAEMESRLDKIANEDIDWVQVIRDFYTPFENDLKKAAESIDRVTLTPVEVEETCPNCDKKLVVKSGRFGKFLACPDYPDCKFTKSFQIKTGIKCPEENCGGEFIEKRSKKGKTFYGCSNYPKCKNALFSKPVPTPCPNCSGIMTEYRKKWAMCTKCNKKITLNRE